MAESHAASPYTVPPPLDQAGAVPEYAIPQMRAYAVPDAVDSAKDKTAGWDNSESATRLDESPTGIPDANRMRRLPVHETRPGGDGDPVSWWKRFTVDLFARHSIEYQDADGHETIRGTSGPMVKDRPRPGRDVPETRPTMKMNPSTYRFMRPWSNGISQTFNGVHFSMADHRRDYPILGMQPNPVRRNTFRIEPGPWDASVVDVPPDVDSSPNARNLAPAVAPAGNRTWRL